jgi:hypothetical protein
VKLCELYSEYPDSACATLHRDALSGLQVRAVEEALPGCQGANRNRRGFRVSQTAGFRRHCREVRDAMRMLVSRPMQRLLWK